MSSTFSPNISTEELLQMLALARSNEANFKQVMQNIITEAKETAEYQRADSLAKAEAKLIENLTADIKDRAVAEFTASGNKKPFAGVNIKVFKTFVVESQETMEKWVEVNLAAAVKRVFDMDTIKAFAKTTPIPGTDTIEEVRAEIASKLS